MNKLLAGVLAATISFAVTRKLTRKPDVKMDESNLVWISAGDIEDEGPIFDIGDEVVTFNPFTEDYAIVDFDFSPLFFKIEDVRFIEEEGIYRYKLEGEPKLFAEDWLMKPMYPFMEKEVEDKEPTKVDPKLAIDYWLLTLHEAVEQGDEKERKFAEEALQELLDE